MTKQRASCSIAVFSLLACISATAAPRTGNPCRQMQHTLDRQIDDLKIQQRTELLQCEQDHGRGSGVCLGLKDQQKQSLRAMRDGRTGQMNDCYRRPSLTATTFRTEQDNTYYNQANNQYPDNDQYPDNGPKLRKVPDPHPRYPRHPSPGNGNTSASSAKPSKSGDHSGDKNPHASANAGGSGGGGATSSVSHNHNSGGGSSNGGSYSGSSHSSGGGSSSYSGGTSGSSGAAHSSGGSGGSYSGGSSSGGSSSSGASSSASSAPSGGHPK